MPPKGQELEDHYFGSIRERVAVFMREVNEELWKLGVSAKTQHNEAAPAQHELAPIYAQVNVAVDHNQLVMETLKKVAGHHGLTCLLHEKPFSGVNGSGKHNNWSLTTDDGINMLEFLLVLSAIIKAVDTHADLLRESAANVGNDLRLGSNEAPPAIISIFLGAQLEDLLNQIATTGSVTNTMQRERLNTGVSTLPELKKDASDRNRTSPFAFTGNKFEFRMVGSSASISSPNVVLNTIVAEAFDEIATRLENCNDFEQEVMLIIQEIIKKHSRIIFNGNGYSNEWVEEAARRGLPNLQTMVDSIPALITDKAIKLFEKFGVFTKTELESRAEIQYEAYTKAINIEARAMVEIASKHIIPAVIRYTTALADSINSVTAAGCDASTQKEILDSVTIYLRNAKEAMAKLVSNLEYAKSIADAKQKAIYFKDNIATTMVELRKPCDELEMLVDKTLWPFPSYGDLIFEL